MFNKPLLAVLISGTVLVNAACTDDDAKLEEPVQAEVKKNEDHEFKVNEQTGKVEFKAEIVYFEFDDSTLTKQGMDRLNALAAYMDKNPNLKLEISGHCDDRGSPEYNLALGQKRAQSVKSYLATLNLAKNRLETVSFGEEKPAAQGRGESIWSQNRRAEFSFTSLKSE